MNIIIKLKDFSNKIKDIALNNHNIKIENEYIDSLICHMVEIGCKDKKQIENLMIIKKNNNILQELIRLDRRIILSLNADKISEKIKKIICSHN